MQVRSPLLALVTVLAACSTADDRGATAASVATAGPEAIVLRLPAGGGAARAYRYPALDTVIWTTRAALPARLQALAFNADAGTVAMHDAAGVVWRLTLGSGQLQRAMALPLGQTVSLDGDGVFGTSRGSVLRLTSSDQTPWQVRTEASLSQLQPLRDGGVLLIGQRGDKTVLTRFRPPSTTAVDSAVLDGAARLISAAGGDRYYLSDGPRRLVSVRARDLENLGVIRIGDSVVATASSPSGDRVYVLGTDDDESRVQVINKYSDEIVAKIAVPANASALRMDPLGRYLLVRHGGESDSVLVIGIASDTPLGRFSTPWREDLPLVFPDGRLAILRGDDVVVLSALEFRPMSVIPGGAKDTWSVVQWNGFRRRAGEAPLQATATLTDTAARRARDSVKVQDSAMGRSPGDSPGRDSATGARDTMARRGSRADSVRLHGDSVRKASIRVESQPPTRPDQSLSSALGERGTFVVQFAALKAERPAQQLAAGIKANGEKARVIVTSTNGTALYRVILGPFRSRAEAERAGQAAGRDYWVFEGGSN